MSSAQESKTQPLNSNPEILLRKRRNADRTRVEKQDLAKKKREEQIKKKRSNKNKFVRAESIVAKTLATSREKERIKRVSILEDKKAKNETHHIASREDFILKITEKPKNTEQESADLEESDDEGDGGLIREKTTYDGSSALLFVVRVRGPLAVNIPHKAFKILSLLRLVETNTGVFVKLSKHVYPLLKVIAPYVVIGKPSLSSTRSLIQKRGRIMYKGENDAEPREIVLNDNNIVEEQLGGHGIICVEDIIHEIATMGDSFSACNFFLQPFKLNREVSGFGSLNRLRKIKQRETESRTRQFSNAATAPVIEVDIDSLLAKLN
ncbi:rlp7p [Saccharomyces arboricola H-6]|uniref:Ribosome biogenesis protein RLP7 n=1 Tax=Saccharomyces arboricola (strain H-6 / AS 2.3317 / CBS 10644) TaxID=1160507 RepID=J8LIN4_SACAR|nr:rlp7p [Saccharomyces arboricola H-6]